MAHLRELEEEMGAVEDSADDFTRSLGTIAGDVLMDLPEPPARFLSPDQSRQDSMVLAISSSEIVRPASTSTSPRSIMRFMMSSWRISSYELSSGMPSTMSTTVCLALPCFGMAPFVLLVTISDAGVSARPVWASRARRTISVAKDAARVNARALIRVAFQTRRISPHSDCVRLLRSGPERAFDKRTWTCSARNQIPLIARWLRTVEHRRPWHRLC